MDTEPSDSTSSPATTAASTSEQRRRSNRTPPPMKLTLVPSKITFVDKNHDLASQVVVSSVTSSGDAIDAKHKRRRRSKGSTLREDDSHGSVVKPPSREIGIQVDISPMPKKSPSRFLSFGKRSDSSNGVKRDADTHDAKTTSSKCDAKTPTTKCVDTANVDIPLKAFPITDSPGMTQQECDQIESSENGESKRNRKKSVKNRDRNIFNKVRKMSQFISALKNSTANKRRKAEEVITTAMQHHNGQCCQHSLSDAKRDSVFGNVTFEEMNLKDNSMLGLPTLNVKFSKVDISLTILSADEKLD